jgi:hypothetical protein
MTGYDGDRSTRILEGLNQVEGNQRLILDDEDGSALQSLTLHEVPPVPAALQEPSRAKF